MTLTQDLFLGKITAVTLGIMQDGGLPHAGCRCKRCAAAFAEPLRMEYAACLAIVDGRLSTPAVYLIDATPDIKFQLQLLADLLSHPSRPNRLRQPDAIFLTHAHMGHIGGLPQFGPEAMAAQELKVYASKKLREVLEKTAVWRPTLKNIQFAPLEDGNPIHLAPDLSVTPISVPHRDEWGAGTFAFRVQGPNQSLLYLPDIDRWEAWLAAKETIGGVGTALLDASFYSLDELNGRLPAAHPLVSDTIARFADLPTRLVLTHLNHTNLLLDENGRERRKVTAVGAKIARTGERFEL